MRIPKLKKYFQCLNGTLAEYFHTFPRPLLILGARFQSRARINNRPPRTADNLLLKWKYGVTKYANTVSFFPKKAVPPYRLRRWLAPPPFYRIGKERLLEKGKGIVYVVKLVNGQPDNQTERN